MLSTQNKTCRATPVSKPVRRPRRVPWTRPAGRAQDPLLPRAMQEGRAIQARDKPHCMTATVLPRQAMSAGLHRMPSHPRKSIQTCNRRMCINHIQRPNTYLMYAQLSFKAQSAWSRHKRAYSNKIVFAHSMLSKQKKNVSAHSTIQQLILLGHHSRSHVHRTRKCVRSFHNSGSALAG